ncbi:hypothetical protein [Deinococcus alpinitundrae]|uniref:hypothetical protein n=1 Tax=Deinococcus alpinitundrae TaxID=468913 RepID=UPI00137AF9F5|nr:hypothetical protein [Deinococcus alpinitundrae]
MDAVFQKHNPYIQRISAYRDEWVHRVSGGARTYSDRAPDDPAAVPRILVPLNPSIPQDVTSPDYLRVIEKIRSENNGEWLMPIQEFADWVADGARDLMLDYLDALLKTKLPTV